MRRTWPLVVLAGSFLASVAGCLLTSSFDGLTTNSTSSSTGNGGSTSSSTSAHAASSSSGSSSASASSTSTTSVSSSSSASTTSSSTSSSTVSSSTTASSSASSSSASSSTGGFPATAILDRFNRADGALGNGWLTDNPGGDSVSGNELQVTGDGVMMWPTQLGPMQEAYYTIHSISPNDGEHEILLKNQQGSSVDECDSIQVDYVKGGRINLTYCVSGTGFVAVDGSVDVTFGPGDVFGARAYPDGRVEAYKNGVLLHTWDASACPFHDKGGRVGLATYGLASPPVVLDDFGGG